MPRNPFIRLSLRKPDMVAGRTEVQGNDTITTPPVKSTFDTVDDVTAATSTVTPDASSTAAAAVTHISEEQEPQQISSAASTSSNKHRIFRRSSWKKMISRFAQQMTSINIGVSAQVQ